MRIYTKFQDFKNINESNGTFEEYLSEVRTEIVNWFKHSNNLSKSDAYNFAIDLFSNNNKVFKDVQEDIMSGYNSKRDSKKTASIIVNNYYEDHKLNSDITSESDKDIEEVNESIYNHYKNVSKSLFLFFMKKINDINLKFEFNTILINNNKNSLNMDDYMIYMETNEVKKNDIEHEFSHSNILSKVLDVINDDNTIRFFVSITKENKLRFGYILNNDTYILGELDYKSNDIKKISQYVTCSDTDISFVKLCDKIKSTIVIINYYKDLLTEYLQSYIDVKFYISVVDDKLSFVIESHDNDILNANYIYNIIFDNNRYKLTKDNFNLLVNVNRNKTFYILNLK